MNTDFLQQKREGAKGFQSVQAEIFDKAGVLAEIGLAAEHIHDDFAHTGGYLVASPCLLRVIGEIRFMTANPEGEIANAGKFFAKSGAKGFGCRHSHQGTDTSGKQEKLKSIFQVGPKSKSNPQPDAQANRRQQKFQPTGSCHAWRRRFGANVCRKPLKKRKALPGWNQIREFCLRGDFFSGQSVAFNQVSPEKIKGPLAEAHGGFDVLNFGLNQINQLARGENFGRLGIIEADVKVIFDRHHEFNAVQSHAAIVLSSHSTFNPEHSLPALCRVAATK
ncbi:MAG: hypothetical protein WCH99_14920 [Verrucomicrobiota bacterium]